MDDREQRKQGNSPGAVKEERAHPLIAMARGRAWFWSVMGGFVLISLAAFWRCA